MSGCRLVQLFIGMARSRAEQDRTTPATDADTVLPASEQCRDGEVESEAQEANG